MQVFTAKNCNKHFEFIPFTVTDNFVDVDLVEFPSCFILKDVGTLGWYAANRTNYTDKEGFLMQKDHKTLSIEVDVSIKYGLRVKVLNEELQGKKVLLYVFTENLMKSNEFFEDKFEYKKKKIEECFNSSFKYEEPKVTTLGYEPEHYLVQTGNTSYLVPAEYKEQRHFWIVGYKYGITGVKDIGDFEKHYNYSDRYLAILDGYVAGLKNSPFTPILYSK